MSMSGFRVFLVVAGLLGLAFLCNNLFETGNVFSANALIVLAVAGAIWLAVRTEATRR